MKKFFYLLLFFISGEILFSQSTYISFPDSNATWNEKHTYGGTYPCLQIRDMEVYIEKDTLINAYNYAKLAYHEHFYIYAYPGCFNNNQYYLNGIYGYYRNDTVNKRVYYMHYYMNLAGPDTLLYDFSKTTGDTVQTGFGAYVIDSITTITIGNVSRKVQHIFYPEGAGSSEHTQIIEGIGSIQGLFPDPQNWEGLDELLCFSQEDQKIYPDTNGVCQHINSIPIHKTNELKIFPNPANDVVHISGLELKGNSIIKIYDFIGKMVKEINSAQPNINVSDLSEGIYFIEISDQDIKFKIVITR